MFDRADIFIILITVLICVSIGSLVWIFRRQAPTMQAIEELASLFNTKGGLIVLLTFMWFCTLGATVAICLWAIIHGVDPQNGVLVVLLSVLTSGAWGNVNGAWLKTMTGEENKKNGSSTAAVTPTITENKN